MELLTEEIKKEVETIKLYFKQAGLRWTGQRAQIVEQALLSHDHFSAEDLLARIRKRTGNTRVHLATVYRTLQVLEEGEFIEGLDAGGGGRLFEHVIGHEHHDHVICMDCGRISEFNDDVMERRKADAAKRLGFTMQRHSLRIYGSCDDLAEKGNCKYYSDAEVVGEG